MGKRIDYQDRKKLLEAQQNGLSITELKKKFNIGDDRTLQHHLRLAEQEAQTSLVKLEILKSALFAHLEEVRKLIDAWKNSLSTPIIGRIYFNMPLTPTHDVEADPLFNSLKEHLPFPTLWKSYANWKNKVEAYITGCQRVMKQIGEEEKSSVREELLKEWGTEAVATALRTTDNPLDEMKQKYIKKVQADSDMKLLLKELEAIEAKLHKNLQEIQARRDHILYSCKLCPGQPRLSR